MEAFLVLCVAVTMFFIIPAAIAAVVIVVGNMERGDR